MDINSVWWFILSLNLCWFIGILIYVIYLYRKENNKYKLRLKKLEKIHTKDNNIKT